MNQPIRILYVDDYPLDRELVRDALEKEHGGFELTEAATRTEFEKKLARGNFDLVLSDFNILGFEGLQVIETVHATGLHLPVIIVTGTGSEEVAAEAIKRGAADYVIKTPKHIQRLPHTIHSVLDKKHLEDERKKTEKLLQESEDKFRSLFESMDEMAVLHEMITNASGKSVDYRLLDCNPAFSRITGISYQRAVGQLASDLYGTQAAPFLEFYEKVAQTGAPAKFEIFFAPMKKHFAISASSPKAGLFLTVTSDITERKNAEQALRDSECQLSRIYNNASDVLFVLAVEPKDIFRFISVNEKFLDITGLSKDQILGKNYKQVIPEPAHALVLGNYKKAILTKGVVRWEETSVYPNGVRIGEVSVSPVFDEKGFCTQLIGSVHDITDRRQAEEALRESESSLQEILRSTADGILAVSSENKVLFANERFAEMWRIPQEIMASKEDSVLLKHVLDQLSVPQSFLKKVRDLYKSTKASFDTLHFKDGRVFERLSRPLLRGKELRGRVWSFRDITERKKAETETLKTSKELKARNEELERFNKVAVGRELRMIELKKEINELKKKLGQNTPSPVSASEGSANQKNTRNGTAK